MNQRSETPQNKTGKQGNCNTNLMVLPLPTCDTSFVAYRADGSQFAICLLGTTSLQFAIIVCQHIRLPDSFAHWSFDSLHLPLAALIFAPPRSVQQAARADPYALHMDGFIWSYYLRIFIF